MVPRTTTSALMMEGTPVVRVVRFRGWFAGEGTVVTGGCCCGVAAPFILSESLVFENIMPRPDKPSRVPDRVVVPDFVMDVVPRAAPGRANQPDHIAFFQLSADRHADLGEMAVARPE